MPAIQRDLRVTRPREKPDWTAWRSLAWRSRLSNIEGRALSSRPHERRNASEHVRLLHFQLVDLHLRQMGVKPLFAIAFRDSFVEQSKLLVIKMTGVVEPYYLALPGETADQNPG